ncbi:hypothetical protein FYJ85_19410 [Victivallaceae bacterium BBE-744-WT-12]|uniref:PBP domain-containing protein n=1 Tax=Victivallis lenta TaxID=2606640 RepID=A0A844G5Q5_9BACT|nr:substrate-binding domain-containing protein [Victivallis lenta]MST99200.1 hypothetical protein [Victivallis lenta]
MKLMPILAVILAAASIAAAELRIADATGHGDIPVRQLALRQALSDPSVPVKYERSGKAQALAGLAGGRFDLVIMDVPAIPADFKGTRKVYGVRALAFYVNVANTLEGAKSDQLRDIFTDKKPRWQDYSFLAADIKRYGIRPGKPGAELMADFLLRGSKLAEETTLLKSTPEVVLMTGADPAAIGFGVYLSSAPVQVKMLAVDGVAPTLKSVREATYPLAVKRAVLAAKIPGETARKFLAEMEKADFRDLVKDAGMEPVEK